jgi:hypothetical protein
MESRFETFTNIRPLKINIKNFTYIFEHDLYKWNTKIQNLNYAIYYLMICNHMILKMKIKMYLSLMKQIFIHHYVLKTS